MLKIPCQIYLVQEFNLSICFFVPLFIGPNTLRVQSLITRRSASSVRSTIKLPVVRSVNEMPRSIGIVCTITLSELAHLLPMQPLNSLNERSETPSHWGGFLRHSAFVAAVKNGINASNGRLVSFIRGRSHVTSFPSTSLPRRTDPLWTRPKVSPPHSASRAASARAATGHSSAPARLPSGAGCGGSVPMRRGGCCVHRRGRRRAGR